MLKNKLAVSAGAEQKETKIISLQTSENKVTVQPVVEVKNLSMEELKNRAVAISLLNQKHDELTDKRKRLERFAIVHEQDNAQIRVKDANGEEFRSSSPKSIAKLIEFWKEEFSEAIEANEKQIKAMFA
jgi:hypothetical protein